MDNIRVRFAPSPTGFLHIGGARTALFNWLFARKMKGTFILRIEDTDEVRSTEESVNAILRGMEWLGLDWDEGPDFFKDPTNKVQSTARAKGDVGPYFQMSRLDLYKKYADQLMESGNAYHCYCAPEELEAMRTRAMLAKRPPKYDGRCRTLSQEKKDEFEKSGKKPVVRFKTPSQGITEFEDIVRGHVTFENALLDDFVLLKASGIPTYQFAVVIDDYLMKVTHVVRGDDHLSNTPRQILIFHGLGWSDFVKNLKFAHLSMILGPDGSRLSKRHGATSVEEYKNQGYLPEAVINYLSLLGWSTEDSQQLFEKEDLIQKFALERCGKSAAIFDPQKLLWMNGEYIRKSNVDDLTKKALPFIKEAGLIKDENFSKEEFEFVKACVRLEQEKIKLLSDVPKLIDFLVMDDFEYDVKAVEKVLKVPGAIGLLLGIKDKIAALPEFTAASIEKLCRDLATEKNIKTGAVFHPLRVATSGRTQGPSLFHYMEVLGKEKVLRRLEKTCATFAVH
ncbi:MAG: glutamate--tRNA ligase [Elusimicrobia bacterium RIFCSPLOWO2_02_FULL_39_32]|nr:MAG: glutamate--tRNA ligase [Elusimicrobia bacterium GWA2_38_7]OGR80097.1 MAG: glutamate--tRNA ligase [Elusimicrobia bacterium RIFCSPHIGHO2_02_FULL_39_36]OGR91108.1 MAG: glutamate--tRNA ligase [Elusimicrobia bacterium RIFCSPLOWO2_02_FULL_39_32]OGS00075.1 MAG: glutamate--tRNA ligase [Elusimicrobia bacterium RIFCSPLOWO2_12_FULL_39_28]